MADFASVPFFRSAWQAELQAETQAELQVELRAAHRLTPVCSRLLCPWCI